jgi:(R,R)-butanediol dehydrogenase/meso-butanediol dehydrogenase/diacetyl reductase
MRSAVVNDRGSFDIETVPDPTPGPTELVLRVTGCGICGSDLKLLEHPRAGAIMGHEFAGEVVARGSAVADHWSDGDRVTALPIIGCGACVACFDGAPAHCTRGADLIGVTGSPGAFAEYVRVSAAETFAIPSQLESALAPMVEPLAVGLHSVAAAEVQPGDSVAVVGAGPIGLAVTLWLRDRGVGEIVVSDPVGARRQKALDVGATAVIDPAEHGLAAGVENTLAKPAAVVFECVGRPGVLAACIDAAAVGGRVIVAGGASAPDTFVPALALIKELSLRFAVYYRRSEWAHTIRRLAQGELDPRPLLTNRVALADIALALADLRSRPAEHTKVIVDPTLG